MSERKVLQKYYPPDFDHTQIKRSRIKNDKLPTVRLMTPFAMKCTRCGTFIPKSRKFNARKQTPEGEKYLDIQKFRFFFKCPDCHGEISFMTDPKNMDYTIETGAKRNFEVWRENHVEETDEERLQRLEQEEQEQDVDAMRDLEENMHNAQRDMAVADALDEIRATNARNEMAATSAEIAVVEDVRDEAREKAEEQDAKAAKAAFAAIYAVPETIMEEEEPLAAPIVPTFAKTKKTKKNFAAALGIKKKAT
jgi:hypothetical protein